MYLVGTPFIESQAILCLGGQTTDSIFIVGVYGYESYLSTIKFWHFGAMYIIICILSWNWLQVSDHPGGVILATGNFSRLVRESTHLYIVCRYMYARIQWHVHVGRGNQSTCTVLRFLLIHVPYVHVVNSVLPEQASTCIYMYKLVFWDTKLLLNLFLHNPSSLVQHMFFVENREELLRAIQVAGTENVGYHIAWVIYRVH